MARKSNSEKTNDSLIEEKNNTVENDSLIGNTIEKSVGDAGENGKVAISCKNRAGKKVIGIGGEIVEFNVDGKAYVSIKQAEYFLTLADVKKA